MHTPTQAQKARFAGFELDLRSSELTRDGHCVRLQGQPFQVLCILLENAGEVVLREEFRSQLWPGETFVDFDHGLNKAISKLRESVQLAGGDSRLIETLPRRGYRLLSDVQWLAPDPPKLAAGPAIADPPAAPDPHVDLPNGAPAPDSQSGAARDWLSRIRSSRVPLWVTASLLAVGAILWGARVRSASSHDHTVVRSVAVLPLENLSANPAEDYFADGVTDELITDLSHIHSLRVISHASASTFKGSHLSVPEIADRLQVDAVVEGTILRSRDKVRINVQLIGAHPEQHLWAAHYERDLGDAVTLQNEIAAAAVAQMQTEITPEEHAQLRAETPVNPEAHDECLRGRFLLEQENPDQVIKAIPHFERAVQLAPGYADAYALLGEGFAHEAVYGVQPVKAVVPQAIAYTRKAIALDPHSSEAYEGLGMSLTLAREWRSSEAMLRHSLELNPNNPRAAEELAILLDMVGRGEEAVHIMQISAAANPVSVRSQRMYANVLYRARHFDQAIEQSRHVLELDPSRSLAYMILGSALVAKGRYAEADQAFLALHDEPDRVAWVAALRGDRRALQAQMTEHPLQDKLIGAVVHYLTGDRTRGLSELDQAANQDWDIRTYFLNSDALFDPMRSDPRFEAILRKTGLPH